MVFIFLLAVVIVVVISENSPHQDVAPVAWYLAVSLFSQLICIAVIILQSRHTRTLLRRTDLRTDQVCRVLSARNAVNQASWLIGIAGTLMVGKWSQIVRYNAGLANVVLVDELLILLPVVLPALVLWGTNYDIELVLAARDNRSIHPRSRRWNFVRTHAQFYFGLIVLPLLLIIGGHDAIQRWGSDSLKASVSSFAWLPMLAGVLLAFPLILRRILRTQPLVDSPLRSQLLSVCQEFGLQVRDILIWYTNGISQNAAVLGLTPWNRYVLLTDGLVTRLDDSEIAAVFRHEVGHIQRRHVSWRLLLVGLPLFGYCVLQSIDLGAIPSGVADPGTIDDWTTKLLVSASLFAYLTLSLGWLARRQEHDADLWAARLYASDPLAAAHAAEGLSRALEKLTQENDGSRKQAGWLHPSIQSRVELLRHAVANPAEAANLQRTLKFACGVIVAAYGGLGLIWIKTLT